MDALHIHLAVCHLPVVGLGIAVAGLAVAFWTSDVPLRRWALALTVLVSLSALPASWSGEGAEDLAASLPGTSMDRIEEHEEAAETATALALAAGGAAALGLLASFFREKYARALILLALVAGFVATGLLAYAANLGGRIRHTEIRD
jgi:hypothetical protein